MRPTRDSTSMRCRSWRAVSTSCAVRSAPSFWSPIISACSTTSSRIGCTCSWTGVSPNPATRPWLTNSRSTATAGSARKARRRPPEAEVYMNPNSTKETYLDAMGTAEKELANAPSWLRELRREAASRFAEVGFPTPRDEAWKYTDVTPIVQAGFKPAARGVNGVDPAQLEGFWFENLPSHC